MLEVAITGTKQLSVNQLLVSEVVLVFIIHSMLCLFLHQVIIYLDEILTNYNHARNENGSQLSSEYLLYHYVCGNLSSYLFSSQLNVSRQPTSTLQTLRNFEDSLTEEMFLRRNKQIARKIIQEIKFERRRNNRRIFFAVGAGIFFLFYTFRLA